MKKFRRIMALLIATVMVMSMGAVAFAEETTYTITINQNPEDKGTHTYGAYQIFKGNIEVVDGVTTLTEIAWGSGITEEGKTTLGDAATYAKSMTNDNAAEKAAELSKYLSTAEKTGTDKIEGLEGGYYLVQDESDSPVSSSDETKPASKTKYILQVVEDVTVTVKSSVPSVEKKVQDINDSTETTLTNLQDSADYDIGDDVPYTITATIGSGIDNYSAYSLQFVDDISTGLTLKEDSWDIKVGETSIKSQFALKKEGTVYTWAATDIKPYIEENSKVVLTYKCTLNENAVIGAAGNPNTVKLVFDNNPNSCGQGKPEGETPEDKNIVFTYKVDVNKIQPQGSETAPLTGADFTLYKEVIDEETEEAMTGAAIKATYTDPKIKATALDDDKYYVVAGKKTGSAAGSTFDFKGVDDGKYVLVETTIPAGYNAWDAVAFEIKATHDVESDDPKLTELEGGDLFKGDAGKVVIADGKLETNILNEQGTSLPSTGGMGTTLFYVVGAALVIGAGVVLVSRRRMNVQ